MDEMKIKILMLEARIRFLNKIIKKLFLEKYDDISTGEATEIAKIVGLTENENTVIND